MRHVTLRLCLSLSLLLGIAAHPRPALAGDLTVFAAASLKTVMDTLAPLWHAQTGHSVRVALAGSPLLARQIDHGAPADVVMLASADWMDHLQTRGWLVPGSRRDVMGNRLVLVAPGAQPPAQDLAPGVDLSARLGRGHLAMALVDSVPAGVYGRAALRSLGLWDGLAQKVAQPDNVRTALALVAMGEAPLGIVYATDAQAEPRVGIAAHIPETAHAPIRYPAAALRGGQTDLAADFLRFLHSPAARDVFDRQGFTPLPVPMG
jgi:molybdate transport system substrate-binding protein